MTAVTDLTDDMLAYPHAESTAARMMAEAFTKLALKKGLSQRRLAAQLGYKSSVVLSHMALGRVPIPIDRASQLAQVLQLDEREFVLALLEQRHPNIPFRQLFT